MILVVCVTNQFFLTASSSVDFFLSSLEFFPACSVVKLTVVVLFSELYWFSFACGAVKTCFQGLV